jgi:tRNA(Ile2) C34 agmatinyltransferase TiaS
MYRKLRDVFDEPEETVTRPCLRCRRPFESEGAHHWRCYPCTSDNVSPFPCEEALA